MVHRDNIPWILDHGLHCSNSGARDPKYVEIGNTDLIDRRADHRVKCAPSGTLSDYVPFYFTPFSPMMFNIKTGWGGVRKRVNEEMVIMASSLHLLYAKGIRFLFTDRHAYLAAAQFYSDIDHLDRIGWDILRRRDFKNDPDDPGKKERYQAETLVHKLLPVEALSEFVCYDKNVLAGLTKAIEERGMTIKASKRTDWYF